MGLYNVVAPCVVWKLHYTRPTAQPIEVDDETAAPLVESGELTRYGVQENPIGWGFDPVPARPAPGPCADQADSKPTPRRPRKSTED
jgi:hypothetical protein